MMTLNRKIKIVALTVAILLSTVSIGEAQLFLAGKTCVVFASIDDMAKLLDTWNKNPEAGSFMMAELIAHGKVKRVMEDEQVRVINSASNGVCQVMVEGKLGYVFGSIALKNYPPK